MSKKFVAFFLAAAIVLLIVSTGMMAEKNALVRAAMPDKPSGDTPGKSLWLDVRSFGAVGDGVTDDTSALQAALAAAANGGEVRGVPGHTYKVTRPLVMANPGVTMHLPAGSKILTTSDTGHVLKMSGASTSLTGFGTIECPAVWHPTSSPPRENDYYPIVEVTGNDVTIRDITIVNVSRLGIRIYDVNNVLIHGVKIKGNLPASQYVLTETVHFGITVNPGNTYPSGNVIITDSIISGCHQGISVANTGVGSGYNVNITGNIFYDCYDHGIYGGTGMNGILVASNSFYNCANPIVVTGPKNVVTGNLINFDGTGPVPQYRTCISVRAATGNVISNNVVYTKVRLSAPVIGIHAVNDNIVKDNIVTGNFIDTGTNPAIAIQLINLKPDPVVRNNTISNNTIKTAVRQNYGAIDVVVHPAGLGQLNKVINNTIVVTDSDARAFGIRSSNQKNMTVSGNTIIYEANPSAATTFLAIGTQNTTRSLIADNRIIVPEGFGRNTTLHGIDEAPTAGYNTYKNNSLDVGASAVSAVVPWQIQKSSEISRTQISVDAMSGTSTISGGSSSVTVNNANVRTSSRIMITPANAQAGRRGVYVVIGGNGVFSIHTGDGAAAAGDAVYNWEIL